MSKPINMMSGRLAEFAMGPAEHMVVLHAVLSEAQVQAEDVLGGYGRRVAELDGYAQRRVLRPLTKAYPKIPVLAEEPSEGMGAEFSGVTFLSTADSNRDLPADYFSVDPEDGSALLANGRDCFAVSVAYVKDHQPEAAAVVFPAMQDGIMVQADRGQACTIGRPGRDKKEITLSTLKDPKDWLVGLDMCKAVTTEFDLRVNLPLTKAFRFMQNLPSCAGALAVLQGQTAAYVTSNARNWDLAGMACAIEAAGGVAECLSGDPIPWNRVKLPPLLFAASQEVAKYVRDETPGFSQRG